MKTYQPKEKEIKRDWHLIDVKDKVLGRISTEIASLLIGKHKTNYVPHLDVGDYVVVINAGKVSVTGNKMKKKVYQSHTGYMGGLKEITLGEQMVKDPKQVIIASVLNMLPKNKLRQLRMRRLKVFVGDRHNFEDKLDIKKENKKNGNK